MKDTTLRFSQVLKTVQSAKHSAKYGTFYDLIFDALLSQKKSLKVLEIGVWGDSENSNFRGSHYAFIETPSVELYVGIDHWKPAIEIPDSMVFIEGDAYTPEIAEKASKHGPYDLIIDDGTHNMSDQLQFFELYSALCAKRSAIVCEDTLSMWTYLLMNQLKKRMGLNPYIIHPCSDLPQAENLVAIFNL